MYLTPGNWPKTNSPSSSDALPGETQSRAVHIVSLSDIKDQIASTVLTIYMPFSLESYSLIANDFYLSVITIHIYFSKRGYSG